MELADRLSEARLRDITEIIYNQYGFIPGKSTTEVFVLRMVQANYREKGYGTHPVFVDFDKSMGSSAQRITLVDPEEKECSGKIDQCHPIYYVEGQPDPNTDKIWCSDYLH